MLDSRRFSFRSVIQFFSEQIIHIVNSLEWLRQFDSLLLRNMIPSCTYWMWTDFPPRRVSLLSRSLLLRELWSRARIGFEKSCRPIFGSCLLFGGCCWGTSRERELNVKNRKDSWFTQERVSSNSHNVVDVDDRLDLSRPTRIKKESDSQERKSQPRNQMMLTRNVGIRQQPSKEEREVEMSDFAVFLRQFVREFLAKSFLSYSLSFRSSNCCVSFAYIQSRAEMPCLMIIN